MKWIAFIMAWMALVLTPSYSDISALERRVAALEQRKCVMMVVSVPGGTTAICVVQ